MASKKDFASDFNPAMAFITSMQPTAPAPAETPKRDRAGARERAPAAVPDPAARRERWADKIIDPNGERRTRRVQLIMRPSLYAKVQQKLDENHLSFASLMDQLLSEYVGEK